MNIRELKREKLKQSLQLKAERELLNSQWRQQSKRGFMYVVEEGMAVTQEFSSPLVQINEIASGKTYTANVGGEVKAAILTQCGLICLLDKGRCVQLRKGYPSSEIKVQELHEISALKFVRIYYE